MNDNGDDNGELSPLLAGRLSSLRRHDLNALVPLLAVLHTGSVSAAARLLGLTQPAVSRTLERLRTTLDDPLVIRQGNGVVPTSRARQIAAALETLVDQAQRVYASGAFDPATVRREMRIAMNEHLQRVLMPKLIERVERLAPGLRLNARPVHEASDIYVLKDGHLDLIVGMLQPTEALRERPLITERLVCAAHSKLASKLTTAGPMTLSAFARQAQIDVQPAGLGHISAGLDALLARSKGGRNVVCILSSFGALLKTLEAGRHIGVVPELAIDAARSQLSIVPLAFELPLYKVSAWWHNVAHHDPAVQWVLGQLAEIASDGATRADIAQERPPTSGRPGLM